MFLGIPIAVSSHLSLVKRNIFKSIWSMNLPENWQLTDKNRGALIQVRI
jgi:hypothetical protein